MRLRNRLGAVLLSLAMMAGVPAVTVGASVVAATPAVADHYPEEHGCHVHTYYDGYEVRYRWFRYGTEWWMLEEHRDRWWNEEWCYGYYNTGWYHWSEWYGWEWYGPY